MADLQCTLDTMILEQRSMAAKLRRLALNPAREILSQSDMVDLADSIEAWSCALEGWEEAAQAQWGANVVPFKPRVIARGFQQDGKGA